MIFNSCAEILKHSVCLFLVFWYVKWKNSQLLNFIYPKRVFKVKTQWTPEYKTIYQISCIKGIMLYILKSELYPPDQCGSVGWVSFHKAKGWGLISGQGTCLGCGPGPQLGRVWEATDQCFSFVSMFLSLSFPLSKNKFKNSLRIERWTLLKFFLLLLNY